MWVFSASAFSILLTTFLTATKPTYLIVVMVTKTILALFGGMGPLIPE